ncbi:MAG: hypothetical protein IT206_04995 [Fimbriimonadaceae bacterium]|nr:hypothetical protein [Fimbriimonadaceae bacterium]
MLTPTDTRNFNTLSKAFSAGHVALVEVRRAADLNPIAAICALSREGDQFGITPFAVMIEGNPFELYDPPSPKGGFTSGGKE